MAKVLIKDLKVGTSWDTTQGIGTIQSIGKTRRNNYGYASWVKVFVTEFETPSGTTVTRNLSQSDFKAPAEAVLKKEAEERELSIRIFEEVATLVSAGLGVLLETDLLGWHVNATKDGVVVSPPIGWKDKRVHTVMKTERLLELSKELDSLLADNADFAVQPEDDSI